MVTTDTALLKTPLYQSHVALGAKMAGFGGWLMPIQYGGILLEHAHTRNAVSVFDICHMGEFLIEADAHTCGLDRVVTQNIVSMPVGSCRYGFMLNEQAGIVDDLIVYRLAAANWMLVVNAATIANDEAHLKKYLTGAYRFQNVSDRKAKLDVQGPFSGEVLKSIFGAGIDMLKYYSFADFTFQGNTYIISRTGYTGERGYEVYVDSNSVFALWNLLLQDPRVKPAGLGARDTLRLEMGYPLYGQDIDTAHSPLAAGFEKFVDFSKDFIGKCALLAEKNKKLAERLVCFQANSRKSPRHGSAIFSQGSRVGTVTSGSFSPSLLVGIGMGYVHASSAQVGAQLIIKEGNSELPVTIVKKPFWRKTSV